jgi:hypothetical protein
VLIWEREEVSYLLHKHIGDRRKGFVFQTRTGQPISPRNIERDSLDSILAQMGVKRTANYSTRFDGFARKFSERIVYRGSLKSSGSATLRGIFLTDTPKVFPTICSGVNKSHNRLDWDSVFQLGNLGDFQLKKNR